MKFKKKANKFTLTNNDIGGYCKPQTGQHNYLFTQRIGVGFISHQSIN